ncbi:CHASE2 domain-containing protein [bacterium]|nr:CHASE2 domain-containing protein [bacterium]
MKLGKFRRSNFGIMQAVCICFVIVAAYALNWFKPTDDLLRNGCIWLTSSARQDDSQLLLVYADPEILENASPELTYLLQEINEHSPKKIGIEANGSLRNFAALNRLPFASQLTIGFRSEELLAHPSTSADNRFDTGFVDLFHSRQPVYRTSASSLKGEEKTLHSLEFEIAQSVLPLTDNLPKASYGIRYQGGANTIPNIKADVLLNGNLLRGLIRDKIVLIGPDYPRQFDMLTPTTTGNSRMSRLEIRGNMVASLLNESYTTDVAFLPFFLVLVVIVAGTIYFARQMQKHWFPVLALASVIASWGLLVVCYWVASVWLPGTAIILAALLSVVVIAFQRFTKLDDYVQFWKIRSTTREGHLQSRFEENVWQAIGDVANQMFQPTRVVMMELEPGATHLKRVHAVGCDYSQIYEKRLDYKRAPYWEPIQNKQATRSSQRGFFASNPGVQETEYILPLVHGMTIYGVIAMAVDVETHEKWADFDSFVNRFCSEMSQLIAGSRRVGERAAAKAGWFARWQTLPEERTFLEIQDASLKQDDLSERVDIAFNACEAALATFDIYGRVIRRNSSFNRLLQKTELSISRASCIEVISTLSGLTMNQSRKIFRDAILHNQSDKHLIANETINDTMMMHIKPMQLQEDDHRTSIETHGLMLEIVDGKVFKDLRQWNHELSSAMVPQVLRKASKLEQATALLKNPTSKEQALTELFGSMGNTVSEIVSILEDCQKLSDRKITELPRNCFLLNIVPVWQSVKDSFSEKLSQRTISISEKFPHIEEIKAIANPILLDRAFGVILQFLLDNAFDDSEIRFEIDATLDGFELRLTNQGGGTPVDTLRKSLNQAASNTKKKRKDKYINLDAAQIDQLREIDEWVTQWNGNFSVHNLPHSITISINLTTLDFEPQSEPSRVEVDAASDPSVILPNISTQQ